MGNPSFQPTAGIDENSEKDLEEWVTDFESSISALTDDTLRGNPRNMAATIIYRLGGKAKIAAQFTSMQDLQEAGIEILDILCERYKRCPDTFFLPHLNHPIAPGLDADGTPKDFIIATLAIEVQNAFENLVWGTKIALVAPKEPLPKTGPRARIGTLIEVVRKRAAATQRRSGGRTS